MTQQLTACFVGCSFTAGEGFLTEEQKDLYVYDRLVSDALGYHRINLSKPGASNHRIFMASANALISGMCDVLFVQWSGLNRIWLSPGPETWYKAMPAPKINEYVYRNKVLLRGVEKLNFELNLLTFNHDYYNIIDLIDYCNILSVLAKQHNVTLTYINGLVPWANDLAAAPGSNLGNSLSSYTKKILDFDHRDDEELTKFFSILQQKFSTMDLSKWVNVFDSFLAISVDQGPAGHHPGIKSNQLMADKIINFMKDKQ